MNDSEVPAKKARVDAEEMEEDFTEDPSTSTNGFGIDDKYNNYVTPEELQKLKEFKILDEVKSDDEDGSNGGESDVSQEIPEEEIEKMLEEDLPDDFKAAPKPKEKPYILRSKIVLEEKGTNPFEVLPLDWICARHMSGMLVYMHRPTRVVTLAKPYSLGKSNIQRHDIPISAIPCLAYRRALEEEEKQKEIDKKIQEQVDICNAELQGDKTTSSMKPEAAEKSENNQIEADVSNKTEIGNFLVRCPFKGKEISAMQVVSQDNQETSNINATADIRIDNSETINENIEEPRSVLKSGTIINATADIRTTDNNTDKPKCIVKTETVINSAGDTEIDNLESIHENTQNHTNFVKSETIINATEDTISDNLERIHEYKEPKYSVASESSLENSGADEGVRNKEDMSLKLRPVIVPGGRAVPPPRVEAVNSSWRTQHLTPEMINDYCKTLFRFKTVQIMHFNRWADRRKYTKARKALQYPALPEGTKLITIPTTGQDGSKGKRDWVMNMNGRCYLSVFHEYVNRALHQQPVYHFTQLENAASPYQATVYIGDMQYGVGVGSSKRQAKAAAARASIQILIPEMKEEIAAPNATEPDFSFFDYVGVEDPRVAEFCAATCEPSPHAILRTCLLRNFGASDRHIEISVNKLEYQKIQLTMKVGKHSAVVVCNNKKAAKQRASQAILQSLHPHVRSWGSLLRLYGSRSVPSCAERKLHEQQITLLQEQARRHRPNHAVLRKLRQDMLRLQERDRALAPVGTLLLRPVDELPQHSGSNLNNLHL